jgi:hypothetical protein
MNSVAAPTTWDGILAFFGNASASLVAAAIILFVAFLVAQAARWALAAAVDRSPLVAVAKPEAGGPTLGARLGDAAFWLVLLFALPQALRALRLDGMAAPIDAMIVRLFHFLPNLLAAALLFALAFAVARFAAVLVATTLPAIGFDAAMRQLGFAGRSAASTPSILAARAMMVVVLLLGAIEAAHLLDFVIVSSILTGLLELGGRIVFGGAIIALGVTFARSIGDIVALAVGAPGAFAAMLTRAGVVALSIAIGLRFMGLAPEIVTLAFGLVLGAMAVAAALAFGLGGRAGAARLVDEWIDRRANSDKT